MYISRIQARFMVARETQNKLPSRVRHQVHLPPPGPGRALCSIANLKYFVVEKMNQKLYFCAPYGSMFGICEAPRISTVLMKPIGILEVIVRPKSAKKYLNRAKNASLAIRKYFPNRVMPLTDKTGSPVYRARNVQRHPCTALNAPQLTDKSGSPFYRARNVQRHPCTALNDTALTGTAPTATAGGSWLHNMLLVHYGT